MTTYQDRIAAAFVRGMIKDRDIDLHAWPEDVRETIETVCKLWNPKPPDAKAKKSKAYWITSARELIDACSEFGIAAIEEYRKDYEAFMYRHNGIAPHTVAGPASLVNPVRAKAGELRSRGRDDDRDRYVSGEFAEFIEH